MSNHLALKRDLRVTQAEIAQRVGASRRQVYNFLSGRFDQLSPALRKRIEDEVNRTAYAPNFQVSLMQGGANPFVAVVLGSGLSPVFQRFLEGLAQALGKNGLHAVAIYPGPEIDFDAMIREDRFGAVITVLGSLSRQSWELVLKKKIPAAAYVGPHDGRDLPIFRVLHDHRRHMADLCDHLGGLGCDSLGVISVEELSRKLPHWYDEQLAALRQEAPRRHVNLRDEWVLEGAFTPRGVARAVDQFLRLRPRPRALLAHNDAVALQVLNQFWARAIRVPEDVALMGRDNLESSAFSIPPLTSLDLHFDEIHQRLLDFVLGQQKGKKTPDSQTVRGKWVFRESTLGMK